MHDCLQRPLSSVLTGSTVTLHHLRAGRELEARLTAMGFVPGEALYIYRNTRPGPLVVGVKGSRVMLGRGMADKVAVE